MSWMICVMRCGIIPARAGFTLVENGSVYDVKDHPRSRGVYPLICLVMARRLGSSPLARGLLEPIVHDVSVVGIIPARAGFTEPTQQ